MRYIITQTRTDAIGIVQENIQQDYKVVNIKWFKFMPLSHLWELIYTPFLALKFKEGDTVLSCNSKSIHTHLLPYFTKAKLFQLHYHFDDRKFALHKLPLFSYKNLFRRWHTIFTNSLMAEIAIKSYGCNDYSVVPLGINHDKFKNLKLTRKPHSILYVGSFGHRKNIDGILRAFALALEIYPDATLTICSISNYKEIEDLIDVLLIKHAVTYLHNVPLGRLCYEYNKAEVFLFPTFVEGFGLPLLEAQVTGCKIVTTDGDVHREVTGNLETYVNPYDPFSIYTGIQKAFERRSTHQDHAKKFSWANTRKLIKKIITR